MKQNIIIMCLVLVLWNQMSVRQEVVVIHEITVVKAKDPVQQLIEASIKLQPKLSAKDASTFSNIVVNNCPVAWRYIAVAIAFQESSLKAHKVNYESGDYGIGQINAKIWGISNPERLLKLEVGTTEMCRILKYKYTTNSDKDWARYHSNNKTKREIYRKLVDAHLNKISVINLASN